MRILLDGMGGDNAPAEIVKGAVEALAESDLEITIIGKEDEIYAQLEKYEYDSQRLSVVNATPLRLSFSPVSGITKSGADTLVRFSWKASSFWKKSFIFLMAICDSLYDSADL